MVARIFAGGWNFRLGPGFVRSGFAVPQSARLGEPFRRPSWLSGALLDVGCLGASNLP